MATVKRISPLASGKVLHPEQGGTGLSAPNYARGFMLMTNGDGIGLEAAQIVAGANMMIDLNTPGVIVFESIGGGDDDTTLTLKIATVIADYAIVTTDATILGDATAGVIAVTLPDATVYPGQIFSIKKVDASLNSVTVVKFSALQTIDGMDSYVISSQYACVTLQSNGISWSILNEKA